MVSKVDEVQFDLPAAALPRKLRVVLDEKATLVSSIFSSHCCCYKLASEFKTIFTNLLSSN